MKGSPRSEQFDDVYFSASDGLAETRHVFLKGNDLPAAWAGRDRFVIAETGFGTGLNFLAAWKLFRETAEAGQCLEYISFEKYPLAAEEIKAALEIWREEFADQLEAYLAQYSQFCHPERNAKREVEGSALSPAGDRSLGFARDYSVKIDNQTILRLIFGDVNETLPNLEAKVDCWFLDGFKPASNPGMWTDTVFENMARLSRPGATFATFTAAGFVKRGLQAAGFDVEKVKGFGTKRDMLIGRKS